MMHKSELETARQIVEILPTVMQIVTAELRRTEYSIVPTQLGVMTMLVDHPCNLSELAEHHLVSLPTMSNIISKMVKNGWVQRTRSQHDRRMLLLEMTPEGLTVWEQIGRQVVGRVAELLAPLSQNDRDIMLAGLAILKQAFSVVPQPFPIEFKE